MDKMDKFAYGESIDYDDIDELSNLAIKRIGVMKLAFEHFWTLDEFDKDELFFYNLCYKWFYGSDDQKGLTNKQKKVLFYYLVQNFPVKDISILLNVSISSVYDIIDRSFKKSQILFSQKKPTKKPGI